MMIVRRICEGVLFTVGVVLLSGCSFDQEDFQRNLKEFEKAIQQEFRKKDSGPEWKLVDVEGQGYRGAAESSEPDAVGDGGEEMRESEDGMEPGAEEEPGAEGDRDGEPLEDGDSEGATEEDDDREEEWSPQRGARIF